ncbi:MAG TPA: inositol 2-dehydrogenase [Acidimicrobiales bacterium]|nr:inositol 2-dehydrogenase [Acidimicrobiales bacterium]
MNATSAAQRPLRVGVIGTGRIGRLHAGLLASQVKNASLVAVSDAISRLAQEVGETLGVGAVAPEELIESRGTDAVAICSSTGTHVDYIVRAAEAGKAIFCEKPISLELAEVDRALRAAQTSGVPLMIGFNRRFDPSHAAVREAVDSGAIGTPNLVRVTSRDPAPPPMEYARVSGGIFLDMTVHDFDMARFVAGTEAVEVHAAGSIRAVPALAEIGDVDTAVITLWHEDGCLSVIDNSRQASYGYDQRVEVLGSKGLVASDNPLANTAVFRDGGGSRMATFPYFFVERYTQSYLLQWEAFVGAVSSGTPVPTSGHDGRAALVLGLAAKKSLAEHRPVRTSEIEAHEAASSRSGR